MLPVAVVGVGHLGKEHARILAGLPEVELVGVVDARPDQAEAEQLRRQGLGARTTLADLLVFGDRGPIDNELRFANEPVRHKVLDIVGDLALLSADVWGHVVAYRSGHPLNVELARTLHERLVSSLERLVAA